MAVRIVTDSTADLPPALAKQWDITVVPVFVRFGETIYRDGVDLDAESFYRQLTTSSLFPATAQPSPGDFLEVYHRLAGEAEAIVSIHLSAKLSGTWNSAVLAQSEAWSTCPIEVLNSGSVSMGLGLVVVAAARAARDGAPLEEVLQVARRSAERARVFFLLDTLEYLRRGGRIGRAQALLGTLINIKPLLTIREGEVHPARQVRTRAKALEALYGFAVESQPLQALAVLYTTSEEDALALADRLAALFPREEMIVTRIGPALGAHTGPGTLGIALLTG